VYTDACLNIDDSWGQNSILDTAEGTAEGYRQNNRINAISFNAHGMIHFGTSTPATRVRVIVACIRAGTTPLSTEDIDTTPYGRRDDDLRTVLFDRTYMDKYGSGIVPFHIRTSLKGIGIHFSGSGATDQDHRNIVIMTCANVASSDANINAHFRSKFSE
jgi:hypothetical protein